MVGSRWEAQPPNSRALDLVVVSSHTPGTHPHPQTLSSLTEYEQDEMRWDEMMQWLMSQISVNLPVASRYGGFAQRHSESKLTCVCVCGLIAIDG